MPSLRTVLLLGSSVTIALGAGFGAGVWYKDSVHPAGGWSNAPHYQVASPGPSAGVPAIELASEHFVFGAPMVTDMRYNFVLASEVHEGRGLVAGQDEPLEIDRSGAEVPGITIIPNHDCVIGYSNRFKVPLWVCGKWTRAHYQRAVSQPASQRDFRVDPRLQPYAQALPEYHLNNGQERRDRGHVWPKRNVSGEQEAEWVDLTTNIIPQSPALNEQAWKALEDQLFSMVAQGPIEEIWIIAGSVFDEMKPVATVANDIAVPPACFKIVSWFDSANEFHACGFVYPQDATDTNVRKYLVPIREIEQRTGLCFFKDLAPQHARTIKEQVDSALWESPRQQQDTSGQKTPPKKSRKKK